MTASIGEQQQQRRRRRYYYYYYGTSLLYDAIMMLCPQSISSSCCTTNTNKTTTTTTTTTTSEQVQVSDTNTSIPLPPYPTVQQQQYEESNDLYITACILLHRYYNSNMLYRRQKRREIVNHIHDNDNTINDDHDDDHDDVWCVSMACLLLASKLHDQSISISNIICTFCMIMYRQRILLPTFLPTIPMTKITTTTTTTTIDDDIMVQLQKEYYKKTIIPLLPEKWQQLSTIERHQVLQVVNATTSHTNSSSSISISTSSQQQHYNNNNNTFLSPSSSSSGPLYTEWYNAIIQMECHILYLLQYRIYDVTDRPPSHYQHIPILAQRYIDCYSLSTRATITSTTSTTSSNNCTPQLLLSSIIDQAYIYARLVVQSLITTEDQYQYDHSITQTIQQDHLDSSNKNMDVVHVTMSQIMACACLYCSITVLGLDDDVVASTNPLDINNNSTNSTTDNRKSNNNSTLSHLEKWKSLLLPPTSNNERSLQQWSSIQKDMDIIICRIHDTAQDPDYYITQSNYCLSFLNTTTSTKSFHGPDSFTWYSCITNVV